MRFTTRFFISWKAFSVLWEFVPSGFCSERRPSSMAITSSAVGEARSISGGSDCLSISSFSGGGFIFWFDSAFLGRPLSFV